MKDKRYCDDITHYIPHGTHCYVCGLLRSGLWRRTMIKLKRYIHKEVKNEKTNKKSIGYQRTDRNAR